MNKIESELNRAGNQLRNPGQAARQKADMIQRTINQGTANMVGALCYVTGIPLLIIPLRKEWKTNQIIRYHAAHARVIWFVMIICACSIIGIPVFLLLFMGNLYLASEAVAGRRPHVPFLTQFIMQRGWM
jgi:uncharacterized membrane protein